MISLILSSVISAFGFIENDVLTSVLVRWSSQIHRMDEHPTEEAIALCYLESRRHRGLELRPATLISAEDMLSRLHDLFSSDNFDEQARQNFIAQANAFLVQSGADIRNHQPRHRFTKKMLNLLLSKLIWNRGSILCVPRGCGPQNTGNIQNCWNRAQRYGVFQ